MAEKFKKKVEKGEEKNAPSVRSSGSKGYKFDESEQYQQKMDKTRQEAVYGTSVSQDVSQKDLEEKMIASTMDQSSLSKGKKGKNKVITMLDRQLAAAKAGAAAIRTTIKVTKETHSLEDVQALASVAYRSVYIETQRSEPKGSAKSKAEAIAKSLSISQKLNKLGAGATPQKLAEAINQRQYCKKFVVNDYPQQARFKVTQKTTYEQIKEFADVTMRTVGTFFAPGRNPAMGEEKLAVLIEGKTPVEVEKAHGELKNMAEEIAKMSGAGQQGYGKYSVV